MQAPRHIIKGVRNVTLFALASLAAACGGGGGGGGGSSGTNPYVPPGQRDPLEPTWVSIQSEVFTPICTACHIGASAPQGLRLDAANSYGLLVGVASAEQPAILRVAPGDPDNSYLIQKLEGTAAVGNRMPLDGTPLPQSDIDVIRQWITNGAPRDAPAPTSPIKVSSLSPLPGSNLLALPDSITAIFDRELDASSVTTASFVLDRSGGDGTFGDGNEVVISVTPTVPLANPSTATLDLSAAASVADTYRVRLIGTGGAPIRDLDANALDGEFAGTFPSGDDAAGGDFAATFEVVELEPTLQSIQENLFSVTCASSGCHSGPAGNTLPSGMDLTSVNASFASLVGVASIQTPALQRVEPGDPDNSYLIQKLEGTGAMERMPFGGPYLEQATIDVIRQWITDGANQ